MARRGRNSSSDYYSYWERDFATTIATRSVRPSVYLPASLPRWTPSLLPLEDRRAFHPLQSVKPAGTFSRRSQRRLIETASPSRLAFAVPNKVLICVRRKTRRQVLHALNKTGRGAHARKHLNQHSQISCR